jgi:hypothetical protein
MLGIIATVVCCGRSCDTHEATNPERVNKLNPNQNQSQIGRSVVHQINIFKSGSPSTSVIKLLLRSRWLFVYKGNTHCKVRWKESTQTL